MLATKRYLNTNPRSLKMNMDDQSFGSMSADTLTLTLD